MPFDPNRFRVWPQAAFLAVALGLGLGVSTGPAGADGLFLQSDLGPENQAFVASRTVGALSYSLNLSGYEDGRSAIMGLGYAVELAPVGTLKFGPAVLFRQDDGSPSETLFGARLSLERYQPTSFGGVYGLAEIGSIDRSWFVLAQATLRNGVGFEVSRGGSETYTETTIAVQRQIGDGPVRLRLGYRAEDREFFLGVSFSTF